MQHTNQRGENKHPGQPTTYNEEKLKKAKDYYQECVKEHNGKYRMPYIEELAVILDIHRDTVYAWEDKFPEFSDTIKRIKNLQRLRLLQRTLGRFNPTGAIFQLKVNHDMIEKNATDITSGGEKIQYIIEVNDHAETKS